MGWPHEYDDEDRRRCTQTLDKLTAAYQRAEALFVEHLDPKQRESFAATRRIKVGDYRIDMDRGGTYGGYLVVQGFRRYCLVPRDERFIFSSVAWAEFTPGCYCPTCLRDFIEPTNWALGPDVWLTILLWLTYNEDEFLRVAVRM